MKRINTIATLLSISTLLLSASPAYSECGHYNFTDPNTTTVKDNEVYVTRAYGFLHSGAYRCNVHGYGGHSTSSGGGASASSLRPCIYVRINMWAPHIWMIADPSLGNNIAGTSNTTCFGNNGVDQDRMQNLISIYPPTGSQGLYVAKYKLDPSVANTVCGSGDGRKELTLTVSIVTKPGGQFGAEISSVQAAIGGTSNASL